MRRWAFVAVGAAIMGGAGTYQFVWSSLSAAVGTRISASPTALGTVFTLFVIAQTLVQLPAGGIRDRYGPRKLLVAAAALMAAGYVGLGVAPTLPVAYASYAVGGLGAGIAYTVAVNTPVKWFDEYRGLATGIVSMAYGGVSFVVIPLVRGSIDAAFTRTLLVLGVAVGVVSLLAAGLLRDPESVSGSATAADGGSEAAETAADSGERDPDDSTDANGLDDPADANDPDGSVAPAASADATDAVGWRTAARTWQFWVFYGVLVVVNGVGLMLIGQSVGFTTGLGLSAATATTVASSIALADGAGLLVLAGLSDRLGEERTAGASLVLCGLTLAGAVASGSRGHGSLFVAFVAAAAFFRSPVFAIFPSLVGRYYGEARSSENYAAIYTAKVPGGVFGGTVTGALIAALGWSTAFYVGAALVVAAGVAALALRPVSTGG
ncbi:MFS transporter (plasmid) [Halobellus limi]|uniref:MFS transporter n=2 Tax=Halobellus limi TaxID=699433 RepID=A0A1H6CT05_9EURY|nr:MFS transporter [Halobellus limi]SEG75917.1 MFS transporter, OFA family, oxalate/formate antiporter [Halobellus limi]